jgi:hypothetical protein
MLDLVNQVLQVAQLVLPVQQEHQVQQVQLELQI